MNDIKDLKLYDDVIPFKNEDLFSQKEFHFEITDINPYLVYIYLKNNFGKPNVQEESLDSKMQWCWQFQYKDYFIEIYDWKLIHTSIAIYDENADENNCEIFGNRLRNLIEKKAVQKKNVLKQIIKDSKHKIIENPFLIYYNSAENLMNLAKFIDELSSENKISFGEFLNQLENQDSAYRSAFLMYLSSFEGFLNILYELYLKEDLRKDRLYERILREQIDIKLRMAPIYCEGFKVKTINYEDERFKEYLRLINLRNDFVHANLNKSLERYLVKEDNCIFIIENDKPEGISSNFNKLTEENVIQAKNTINNIIELIFESLETKTKREFKRIIYQDEIEVEDEDGILIPI